MRIGVSLEIVVRLFLSFFADLSFPLLSNIMKAIKMKKYNQDGKLTSEFIQSIMEEEKPNQK